MWEVGLWGPKNVGSGTFKMLCHPPPPLFNDIRQRYIAKHFRHFWPSDILFVNMMSNKSEIAIRDLAVFIYHMFNIHGNFNSKW